MPGLDEFNRFVNKSADAADAPAAPAAPAGAAKTPANVRYVLRHGITVAVPVEVGDGALAGLNGKLDLPASSEEPLSATSGDAAWNRLPHHIQLLASIPEPIEEEVAAKYYTRGFKETRQQLIERLLNPTLTLEETARVLGVCPATVRRYTNRNILPHHRTVGQQRRFRLSDVLEFLEQQYSHPASAYADYAGRAADGTPANADSVNDGEVRIAA